MPRERARKRERKRTRTDSPEFGDKVLSFQLFDADGEVTATSTATLSGSGTVLEGTTTQNLIDRDGGVTQSVETTYSWRAEKFINHPQR